jgi:hypothetical protein
MKYLNGNMALAGDTPNPVTMVDEHERKLRMNILPLPESASNGRC